LSKKNEGIQSGTSYFVKRMKEKRQKCKEIGIHKKIPAGTCPAGIKPKFL